jgi:fibronectin-binding autotransporter adhesin
LFCNLFDIHMKLLSRSFVKIVAFVVAAPSVLSAANVTWTGSVNGTWDIGTINWFNGGAAAYADGDVVFFDDTAPGTTTLTIAPGGVLPAGINANHSTKNYSIGGGPLGGTGILTKSGTGILTFTGANTFSGGSIVSQGTLVTTNATGLGTGIVTLGDAGSGAANMQLTLSANVANNIVVSNNGTGTATIFGSTQFQSHSGTIALNRATIFEKTNTGTNDHWYSFGTGGISGTGPLTIKGGGGGTSAAVAGNRAVLEGNNTFSGGTTIESGMLQLNTATAAGTGSVTLGNANTGTAVTQLRIGGNIGNTIIVSATAPSSAAGIATYNGLQTLAGGLQVGRAVTIHGAGDRLTWSGVGAQWSGSGDITISGGRVTHDGVANTWTGNMIINASSTFQPGNAATLTSANSVTVNGTLQLNSVSQTINGLSGSGTVRNIVGGNTLTVGAGNASSTFSGSIVNNSGTMTLVKTGTGTLTLSGATSTYTGGTTISGGTIAVTNSGALGTGAVTLNGGTLNTSVNLTNNIVLNNVAGNTIAPNGNYRLLSGAISGAGGFTLANGGGTPGLELNNAANNFAGNVTTNSGTFLRLTNSEVLPNTASIVNNGNLRLDVTGGGTETIGGLSGTGSVWVPTTNSNLHTFVVGANNATASYGGTIGASGQNNASLALEKIGTGTLTFSGANLHGAGTKISAGTIEANNNAAFGTGTITLAGGSIRSSGNRTIANNLLAQAASASNVVDGGSGDMIYTGSVTGTGIMVVNSGVSRSIWFQGDGSGFNGTIQFTNVNNGTNFRLGGGPGTAVNNSTNGADWSGTAFELAGATGNNRGVSWNGLTGATVQLGSLSGTGRLFGDRTPHWEIGALNTSTTYSGLIEGTGTALTKTGTGTQTLSGGGNASGGVIINGGTLKLQVDKGFNEGYFQNVDNVSYAINSGATLELAGNWVTRSNSTYNINGGTISATNAGGDANYMNVINFDGAAGTISGTAGIRAGFFFNPTYTATATGSGSSITTSLRLFDQNTVTDAITFNVADGAQADDLTVSGQIIADPTFGGLGLTKTGAGRLVLSNSSNNFNGVVSINGGILSVPHLAAGNTASALGAALGTSGNLQFNGGTLEYTGPTVSGINRAFTLNAGGGTISVTDAATNLTWTDAGGAGPIIGTGALTKTGPGTLTMAGANTFSGGSVLSQGTIQLANGSGLGTGTITINDTSTGSNNTSLLATGAFTVGNNIVVTNNGTGTVTIGTTSFNPGPFGTFFSGTLSLAKPTTLTGGNADRTTYTNVISGNVGTLTIAGDRRTTFEVANTFVGAVNITGTGTILQIGTGLGGAQSQLGAANALTVNSGNSFYLNLGGGGSVTAGSLAGGGTVQLHPGVGGTQTLIIGTDNTSTSFSGTMGNGGGVFALVKTGTGTQTLTGANTYSGGTTINGGRLLVNNTAGSGTGTGAITVGPGAILGGSGFITTTGLTVQSGGTLAPGNSPQNLTVSGPVVLSAGSLFGVDVGVNGVMTPGNGTNGTDLLTVNGTINVTGALLGGTWGGGPGNVFTGTFGPANMTWIINNDDGGPLDLITGTFANSELSPGLSGLFGTPAYFTNVGGQPFALFYNSQFGITNALENGMKPRMNTNNHE